MPLNPDEIRLILENTEIVRQPRQLLATFGSTVLEYFVVTEPSYSGLPGAGDQQEAVVRTGKVTAARPQIITPLYLLNLFQGFEHGQEYARFLRASFGPDSPGLMYRYEQEPGETSVVSDPSGVVALRIAQRLDEESKPLAAVIRGVDQFWDISLAHFMYGLTVGSAPSHAADYYDRGLLVPDSHGMPLAARQRIEEMFAAVKRGSMDGSDLKTELDRWGVFAEYEDRFLGLYRRS